MAAKRSKSPKRRKSKTRRKAKAPKSRKASEALIGRKKPKRRRRTAAQKAATERMLAANRAKRGKKGGHHSLPALPSHFRGHQGAATLRPGTYRHHSHAPEAKTLVLKPRGPHYSEFED